MSIRDVREGIHAKDRAGRPLHDRSVRDAMDLGIH